MTALVAYVPVLHEGYRRFFESYPRPRELYVFGPEIIARYEDLAKEIRQLDPQLVCRAIESWGLFDRVAVLDQDGVAALAESGTRIAMPDEEINRELAEKYFSGCDVTFDPIFLRWDRHNALKEKPVVPDEHMTRDEFHRRVMAQAEAESHKSSDIWRHVGAAIVKDGAVVLVGHNHHVPSPQTPYAHGDPRNNFSKGQNVEFSTAMHAEAGLIAEAARRGLSLAGTEMYVTVFPCPPCAKLIAYSGVTTLYCAGGYAVLDGEDILKSRGVKIIFVE